MGTRSKGMKYGEPRDRHPLTAENMIHLWRYSWCPGFPRPPKRQTLKTGKRFKNCRKGKP